ncbi:hypothetical protein [Archangium primigenium]|uniref:hypothetical protein n=1 Tax=[Archangium] primigenium TaxID=2792470 RepID=UPI00195DA892|nr:hypothetical protein [Archangium primigenium]MBM7116703.1 hypothetical protein [Archangium primigenium]
MSGVDFTALTSNVAKYSKSTRSEVKKQKSEALGETIAKLLPSFINFQEVTSPSVFKKYIQNSSAFKNIPTSQYAMHPGPTYKAGTYHESYPLMYNTAMIHQRPKLYVMNKENTGLAPYSGNLIFGKKNNQPRPTSVYGFNVPIGRYNLRPPSKDNFATGKPNLKYRRKHSNLKHRKIQYQPMSVINVHTSPSISTISKQVEHIRKSAEVLKEKGHSTMASGDWYAERGAKIQWAELEQSEDWNLAAPEQNTSFPGKGKLGQTADHFLLDNHAFTANSAHAIPPPNDDYTSLEDHLTKDVSADQLEKWRDINIDHAPVLLHAKLNPLASPSLRKKRKLNDF